MVYTAHTFKAEHYVIASSVYTDPHSPLYCGGEILEIWAVPFVTSELGCILLLRTYVEYNIVRVRVLSLYAKAGM